MKFTLLKSLVTLYLTITLVTAARSQEKPGGAAEAVQIKASSAL